MKTPWRWLCSTRSPRLHFPRFPPGCSVIPKRKQPPFHPTLFGAFLHLTTSLNRCEWCSFRALTRPHSSKIKNSSKLSAFGEPQFSCVLPKRFAWEQSVPPRGSGWVRSSGVLANFFSVQPLCSLCLFGEKDAAKHTTETQRTQRVALRKSVAPTRCPEMVLTVSHEKAHTRQSRLTND